MGMSIWNPSTWNWPSFRGEADNSIPTENGLINGVPTNFSFDVYGGKTNTQLFYKTNEKFVKLVERNFVLSTVIGKIAKSLSNAKFTDTNSKGSKLLTVIENPNQFQSTEEFLKEFAIYTLASGYSLIWQNWGSYGFIDTLQLININPDKAEILTNSIKFDFQGKSYTIDKKDFIIFYDIKRNYDNNGGYSRITPLKTQVTNIEYAQLAKGIQITNSGVTLISPKARTTANGDIKEGLNTPVFQMPTPEGQAPMRTQQQDIEDKLHSRGVANRFIVSTEGLDANNIGAALAAVKFYDITEPDALAIYDAFGFPIELSPYGKSATFENKSTAEASLYDNEVMPLAMNLVKSLNSELGAYGELIVDYNHVSAVVEKKNEIYNTQKTITEMYIGLFEKGLIDSAETKKILIEKGVLK